jgi:hypothetical protein
MKHQDVFKKPKRLPPIESSWSFNTSQSTHH